jgi:hypothetical protein
MKIRKPLVWPNVSSISRVERKQGKQILKIAKNLRTTQEKINRIAAKTPDQTARRGLNPGDFDFSEQVRLLEKIGRYMKGMSKLDREVAKQNKRA